jgi:hypothetical protein
MRLRYGRRSRRFHCRLRARQFALGATAVGTLFSARGCYFRLNARELFGALTLQFGALRFDARGFSGCGFVHRGGFGCRLSRGGLLFGGGLNVGGFPATAGRRFGRRDGCRDRLWSGVRATSARGRRGRRRALGARAFFAFPARANSSNLVVAEHAHMATNRDIHLPKQTDDLIGRNPEFVRQLAHCELAQTSSPILLACGGLGATSSRTPAAN